MFHNPTRDPTWDTPGIPGGIGGIPPYIFTWAVPQKKIHCLQPAFQDGLVKCGVSCDGTWQRRGFSFLDGCVTAISMDTGKILDVLSKVIVKQSRPLKQSHCYKMSITRAIRNPLG